MDTQIITVSGDSTSSVAEQIAAKIRNMDRSKPIIVFNETDVRLSAIMKVKEYPIIAAHVPVEVEYMTPLNLMLRRQSNH